jgi:hypothetical protein
LRGERLKGNWGAVRMHEDAEKENWRLIKQKTLKWKLSKLRFGRG